MDWAGEDWGRKSGVMLMIRKTREKSTQSFVIKTRKHIFESTEKQTCWLTINGLIGDLFIEEYGKYVWPCSGSINLNGNLLTEHMNETS